MTSRRLAVGVDSSTQSTKVELRDLDTGALVASGSAPHPVANPPRSEQDPDAWWAAFTAAFRSAASKSGKAEIVAISVAAQCHGLVVLDEMDRVIRPAKLWNDTTSSPELGILLDAIGRDEFVRRVGTLPTAAFTISKVAWLRAHEPENFARVRRMMLPHDYLTYRLSGAAVTDRSEASGTGYFDAESNAYLPEFLAHIDRDTDFAPLLPRVVGTDEIVGEVRRDVLDELGISGTVRVGSGGGDQHAAALGLGVSLGDVVYSFGTSGVVSTVSRDAVHDLTGTVDGVADMTGGYMPLASTLNAAKVTDTFARILGVDHPGLSALALAAPVDRVGPVLAAYLDGERTPDLPGAVGILGSLTNETGREDIARAAIEGVILGLVSGQHAMGRLGIPFHGDVLAVGGGARSAAYPQLLADLLDRPVLTADAPEATARGAAVQAAAIACGVPVSEQRDRWAPARTLVAEPRRSARDPWPAYRALTSIRSLDRS